MEEAKAKEEEARLKAQQEASEKQKADTEAAQSPAQKSTASLQKELNDMLSSMSNDAPHPAVPAVSTPSPLELKLAAEKHLCDVCGQVIPHSSSLTNCLSILAEFPSWIHLVASQAVPRFARCLFIILVITYFFSRRCTRCSSGAVAHRNHIVAAEQICSSDAILVPATPACIAPAHSSPQQTVN